MSPPYGYAADLVKACVAGLLRGKKIRVRPDAGDEMTSFRDPGVKDLFAKDRDFRRAEFFPAAESEVGPRDRVAIRRLFQDYLRIDVDPEDEPIADAVFQHFPKFRDDLRDVERRFNELPGRPQVPVALQRFGRALEDSCRSRLMQKTVVEVTGRDLGSLEQGFVDRLVEQMSSFLLAGRAWTVDRVNHEDRVVTVREAPSGVKPSWGGYIPSMLGYELCQRVKRLLVENVEYPYVDAQVGQHLREHRGDLGELLRRPEAAVQIEPDVARWWTFAGGRINHTLKYGFEIKEGWKVVADNFLLRIEGNGIGHESIGAAIGRMSEPGFWTEETFRRSLLGRLPNYRLSKFQDCLPEMFALETVERHLLDVEGTVGWLPSMD